MAKDKVATDKYAPDKCASGRFAGLGSDSVIVSPTHYHVIAGPSTTVVELIGPSEESHEAAQDT